MKQVFTSALARRQRGAVAVEAALCIALILIPLFYLTLVFGKFFWYYTAAQKAVHDAALYMASAPLSEIKSRGAEGLAAEILAKETDDFDGGTIVTPSILCGYKPFANSLILWSPCSGTSTPAAVQAAMEMNIAHPFFSPIMNVFTGSESIHLWVFSQVSYVGT